MPNETTCPRCQGLCEREAKEIDSGPYSTLGYYTYRSIAAERAEREAWEEWQEHCAEHYSTNIDGMLHSYHHEWCDILNGSCTFDTCPLRLKNVPSQDGHETEEAK